MSLTAMVFHPLASITQERDATRNFIEVLEREQDALKQADISLLLPLAKEKAHQAQQILVLVFKVRIAQRIERGRKNLGQLAEVVNRHRMRKIGLRQVGGSGE